MRFSLAPVTRSVRLWRARRAAEQTHGAMAEFPEYGIRDGVNYDQPLIVPRYVAQAGQKAVASYLESPQQQTMRFQFDPPGRSGVYDGQILMPVEDPLEEWAFDTRQQVLTNCHAAYQRNPIARRAVNVTEQFAVGRGCNISCRNQDVQRVVDAFIANPENNFYEYQKTFVRDLMVDGELFIRRFSENGQVVIVPLRPWDIPDIETERGFFRRVRSFHLYYSTRSQSITQPGGEIIDEWIEAGEVQHVAINRHSYELRGRPDLYVILPWLRAYKEWLENRARQNQWRGALLWDVAVDSKTPGATAAAVARWKKPPTPGSAYVHSTQETVQPLTNNVNAGDASEDGRQIRMMSAIGMDLAEYMLGDGENANLATATAQQLPALWKFTDVQQIMIEQVWTPILRWVIQAAIDNGDLPALVEVQDADGDPITDDDGATEMIDALQAFDITYPDLLSSDPKTLAEALALATTSEWISTQGAASTFAPAVGLDASTEAKRIEREREQARDRAGQGLTMPTIPDMMPGDMPDNGVGADNAG